MICGKTIYPTLREAIEAIKGLMRDNRDIKYKANKLPSRAYLCDECNGYHLYTENKKAKKVKSISEDIDTESKEKKHNDKKFKDLIIHEPRKFKVK